MGLVLEPGPADVRAALPSLGTVSGKGAPHPVLKRRGKEANASQVFQCDGGPEGSAPVVLSFTGAGP